MTFHLGQFKQKLGEHPRRRRVQVFLPEQQQPLFQEIELSAGDASLGQRPVSRTARSIEVGAKLWRYQTGVVGLGEGDRVVRTHHRVGSA
ncbi:hypothetical protein [Streptomyces formicae]|uniref:hypothetical protein n=1 Tax=Streptomyces formicae TaxID=1616117 RepID=UPI001F5956EA|nr:hypothetical protein [Streptomyces formicae]